MQRFSFRLIFAMIFGLFLASCGTEPTAAAPKLHERIEPKTAIDLPPVPNFDEAVILATPVDGVYSPWGLLYHRRELTDTVVRVKGTIADVSEDCPSLTSPGKRKGRGGRKERGDAPKCQSLSFVIADETGQHKVRVAGYHPFYHPHLKVGMTADVTGQYARQARLFGIVYIEPDNGLIIAHRLHGMGVNRAGKFTADRGEIAQMRARGELLEIKHEIKKRE